MKKIYHITLCLLLSYTVFPQTISSNAPLCGNQNLTLELAATGGSTYAWKGPNGFTSTQQKPTLKNVNWKNRGVYTVLVDNKTTLTTDINIKDPVAFTVPKEISVCEGGTLLIEPKSARLTDSTEVADYYSFSNKGVQNYDGLFRNITSGNIGNYTISGESYSNGCKVSKLVPVTLNTSSNCKSIQIEDLTKVKMCYGQEVVIPFTTKGNFPQGTKFKIYVVGGSETLTSNQQPIAIVEKSPVILKIPKMKDHIIRIIIVADDAEKTLVISNPRDYSQSFYYDESFIKTNSVCDSSQLSVNNTTSITSLQWLQDGKIITNAIKPIFVAKKTGVYGFKYQFINTYYEADKTCLYESQPIKIELGKIEKPSAYVSNDVELCVGKPATLTVSTKLNTNYRWKKDGVFIANATKATFETLQEGKYQVEAKEGTCTAVSDTVVLKKPERLERFYIEPINCLREKGINDTYQVCNNQSFDFDLTNFSSKTRMQCFRNGEIVKDTISNYVKSIKGEGTYFIKASYGTCTDISNSVSIKYDKFIRTTTGNRFFNKTNVCEGVINEYNLSSGNLYNTIKNIKFRLQKGEIFNNNDVIQSWNAYPGYYSSYFNVSQSGNYYAIGNLLLEDGSQCGIYSDTIKINFAKKVQDKPYYYDEKLGAIPIASCKDTVSINTYYYYGAGDYGRGIAYKWTKDGMTLKQDSSNVLQATQVGTYQLETTYKGGCVVVSPPYKVELEKIDVGFYGDLLSTICEGYSTNLYVKLPDSSRTNVYNFIKDGKILSTGSISNITFILTQSGTYKLTVKNGKCEGTSPDFVLKVDKIPTTISPTDSVVYCGNKTLDLKVSTEAGLSYIWERNGSVIGQANQPTLSASTDGLYRATLLRGSCWGSTPSVKLKSLPNIIPTATLTGDQKIDYDKETKLSINLSSYAPWTFKLSDGKEYTATKSPFEIAVKPLFATTYSLSEVKNICGMGTVSGTAKIEIIILSAEEEKELHVEVFPVPSSEICHWKIETPAISTASVVLYDVSGSTQYTHTPNARSQTHEGTIDLSTFRAGTYFLKLQAGEKSVVRKVVKY